MTMEERKAKIIELSDTVGRLSMELRELSYAGWKPSQAVLVPALVSADRRMDGGNSMAVVLQPSGEVCYVDPFSLLPDDRQSQISNS